MNGLQKHVIQSKKSVKYFIVMGCWSWWHDWSMMGDKKSSTYWFHRSIHILHEQAHFLLFIRSGSFCEIPHWVRWRTIFMSSWTWNNSGFRPGRNEWKINQSGTNNHRVYLQISASFFVCVDVPWRSWMLFRWFLPNIECAPRRDDRP